MYDAFNWEKAIDRWKIPKVHQSASLDKVEKIEPAMAKFGREWVKSSNKKSLFLTGNAGSGKTFFAHSIFRAMIESTPRAEVFNFVRSDDLDSELLKAVKNEGEEYTLEKYHSVPFLFIDDLGVERVSERIIKQYYSIIDRRLNNLMPTIFTSNIPLDKINSNLGDRIASRLEMCEEIKFPKRDLRKEMF